MATNKTDTPLKAAKHQKRCFLITPIGAEKTPARQHADWVFFHAIEPVFRERGYESSRADLISDPFMINDSVFEAITEADICVADLTMLNANVFYELGIRHALEQPVIHIAQSDTPIPFDNAGYRTILFDRQEYQSMEMLKNELGRHISAIENPSFQLSNPLTQYRGRERISESADSSDQMLRVLQEELASHRRSLSNLRSEVAALRSPPTTLNAWTNPTLILQDRPATAIETLRAYGADHQMQTVTANALAAAAAATQRELDQIDRENAASAVWQASQAGEIPPG